jgi:hypothetical protein
MTKLAEIYRIKQKEIAYRPIILFYSCVLENLQFSITTA